MPQVPGAAAGKGAAEPLQKRFFQKQRPLRDLWLFSSSQTCERSSPRPNWRLSVDLGGFAAPEAHRKPAGTKCCLHCLALSSWSFHEQRNRRAPSEGKSGRSLKWGALTCLPRSSPLAGLAEERQGDQTADTSSESKAGRKTSSLEFPKEGRTRLFSVQRALQRLGFERKTQC